MPITMQSTIDKAGRVVIPKQMRKRAGLEPGTSITITYDYGRIEIEPTPVPFKLVKRGRLLVIVPEGPTRPGPVDPVEAARRERAEDILGVFLDGC